ncbi:hypothetical protein B0H17DRAFT_1210772 [Mycena rosella]|uniref:Peptidylprolyl isomerase n=1 Tax=Mycena rosella TaxID=1033263 RepID=A0AAD7CVF2_MYCRO|nr:hypothetical protein B0H17DRAFT_1210772 [Mycena rosella]
MSCAHTTSSTASHPLVLRILCLLPVPHLLTLNCAPELWRFHCLCLTQGESHPPAPPVECEHQQQQLREWERPLDRRERPLHCVNRGDAAKRAPAQHEHQPGNPYRALHVDITTQHEHGPSASSCLSLSTSKDGCEEWEPHADDAERTHRDTGVGRTHAHAHRCCLCRARGDFDGLLKIVGVVETPDVMLVDRQICMLAHEDREGKVKDTAGRVADAIPMGTPVDIYLAVMPMGGVWGALALPPYGDTHGLKGALLLKFTGLATPENPVDGAVA